MSIQTKCLKPGQPAVIFVHVFPFGLDKANFWISEIWNCFLKEIRLWNKVGIEDGNEGTLGKLNDTNPWDPLGAIRSFSPKEREIRVSRTKVWKYIGISKYRDHKTQK